jgi:hypothetical protein
MSVQRGETRLDILYIGLQPRKVPVEGESSEFVYSITKDKVDIFHAPNVTLCCGTTYRFVIDTPGYPFYITTDPAGGGVFLNPSISYIGSIEITPENTDEKGNVGLEKGVLTWTPESAHSQMTLYYQSNFHSYAGNRIIVKLE